MTVNGNKHTITETMDTLGRSTGYVLDKNATPLDTVAYAYSEQGRLAKASFQHGGEEKIFAYSYLPGTDLVHAIAHPNGITVTRTYEERRELATSINATRGTTDVVLLGYTYDQLGRLVTRKRSRQAITRSDNFAYNDRSELTNAILGTTPYTYEYDNIGNRETAQEAAQALTTYAANPLNQYSGITQGAETPFTPEYDAAGNQTKVKTSTGIWAVAYDANNRPVSFTSQDGQTVIACGYDYMGRRFMKKVSVGATVKLHQFYLYRGYLQIAALDMTCSNLPALWFTQWDPTQPVATRPLSIRKNGTWYTYGHDLTKNVTELYQTNGTIAAAYDYTPYGAVTATGIDQPFQWSCEVYDAELGMVYYNYRHYNPIDGRWIGRDPIGEEDCGNLYGFVANSTLNSIDWVGLKYCHREVILTHYGDLKSDKVGTRDNKLKPGDVASGHYGKDQFPKKTDKWVLPFGTPVKIYPQGGKPFSGKVSDVGAFDKKRKGKIKPEDWIDVWNPDKSKKNITEKGCIEIEIEECKECPNTYVEGKCKND